MVPHIINPALIVYLQISLIHDWENLYLVFLKHKNYEYAPWQIKPQHLQFFLLFLLSFRISMKLIFILYFQHLFWWTSKRERWLWNAMLKFFKNSFIAHFVSTWLDQFLDIFILEIFILKLYYILWSLISSFSLNYFLYLIMKDNL